LGFRIVASEVASIFDDMFVDHSNDSLNVRVAHDRGFLDAEVSPPFAPDKWLPLGHLRQIAMGRDLMENVTIDEQAEFLRFHFPTIVEMLSEKNLETTVIQIRNAGRDRFKKRFPGSVRDP
jgi:hypothetical protein